MQKIALVAVFVMAAAAAVATPYLSGPQLRSVQMLLARAAEEGLDPAAYGVALAADTPAGQAAVTHALLDYMRDVRSGRPQLRALHSDVLLPPDDFDAAAALDQALAAGHLDALLTDLPPPDPGYQNLKPWLAHYQRIAAAGGWPVLTAHADSALLRTRLAFEDEITGLPDAVAVARFQAWHGLTPGGTLDAATLAALNVPALARANSIAANMERWRWLPRQLEPDRIVINVADARLDLFLDGKHVLTSRVIVGKPSTPTPILRAQGAGVTLNPPWTVPASIAAREILPKLKRNPAYLVSQDMILVDGPPDDPQGVHINWRAIPAGHFPYKLQQRPGPANALGRIKIELPNQFDVYLHDTPAKAAFNGPHRDVSHGCVRVEQILPLASYALSGDLGAVAKINDGIKDGATGYLPMTRKLPIYFLYWTAFMDADGVLQFRPDIYGRDRGMVTSPNPHLAQNPVKCSRA